MVPQKTTRASKPSKTKSIFGFTLIELIVVITILAILGTIGFLSIGGYSSKARDSSRIGDAAQISKSLDLSIVTAWVYPTPDNAFTITYSWGSVWTQGTVGANVLQVFHSSIAGGGLNKKPVDPLTNTEYVYSSLTHGKAYQLKVNYEGDLNQTAWNIGTTNPIASLHISTSGLLSSLTTPSLIEEAKAAPGAPSIAYIRGNYGGLVAKTVTWGTTYVLAVPSIITSSGSTGDFLNIGSNALSGTLLFSGKPLKSASSFNPNVVVYSGSSLPTSDTAGAIATMMTNLKSAYSGATDIHAMQNISTLLGTSTTGSLVSLGSSVITSQLGGAVGTTYAINPTAYSNCSASTYSGVTIPAMNHGVSQSFNKVIASGTGDVTALCSNGTLSHGSLNTSCTTNYVASGAWLCTLDTCTGSAPAFSQINGTQGTASWAHSTTAWVCKYQCQAGYYYNGSNACIAASAGYYVPAAGATSQTISTAGYYVPSAGATTQSACTAGYYCTAGSTTATQNLCPANSYCPAGSGSPTACTGGSTSPSGSTSSAACVSPNTPPMPSQLTNLLVTWTKNGSCYEVNGISNGRWVYNSVYAPIINLTQNKFICFYNDTTWSFSHCFKRSALSYSTSNITQIFTNEWWYWNGSSWNPFSSLQWYATSDSDYYSATVNWSMWNYVLPAFNCCWYTVPTTSWASNGNNGCSWSQTRAYSN